MKQKLQSFDGGIEHDETVCRGVILQAKVPDRLMVRVREVIELCLLENSLAR